MAQQDTVARILDAAESLFAERGFSETSLRTITARAGVNLAAVNYHFGSKKELIQAVFERFLTPFCEALDTVLDRRLRERAEPLPLDDLLAIIATVVLELNLREPARSVRFMRLVGLAYTESQGHLRRWLGQRYGQTFERLNRLLGQAVPDVPQAELFWRFHFTLGTVLFTMSGLESLLAISEREYGRRLGFGEVATRIVPFIAHGIRQSRPA